jgi:MFS family permease
VPALLANKDLWLLTVSYALQGYVSYVFVFYFFKYLQEERHFGALQTSWLATAPWLLGLVTTPLGGLLSDWQVRRFGPVLGRRLVPLCAMVLAGVLLWVGPRMEDHPHAAVAVLAVCEALLMGTEGAFWASAIQLSRAHAGAGGGFLNTGGNLGGVFSPLVTSRLIHYFGWLPAFDVAGVIAVAGGVLWLFINLGAGPAPPEEKVLE